MINLGANNISSSCLYVSFQLLLLDMYIGNPANDFLMSFFCCTPPAQVTTLNEIFN